MEKKTYFQLNNEVQERLVNQYIDSNEDVLKGKYPEIQGISARINNDEEDGYYAVHFDLEEKRPEAEISNPIPSFLSYKDNQGIAYDLPTDIDGVGETTASFSNGINSGDGILPKQMGMSCSREGADKSQMGTIGMKVHKDGAAYLLSCFHVLCSSELKNKKYSFTKSGSKEFIVSPGQTDGDEPERIAYLETGFLNENIDAALARLTNENFLENRFYPQNTPPQGLRTLTTKDAERKITLKLNGRTSKEREGYLIDQLQNFSYINYGTRTAKNEKKIKNLIITSKMSDGGDSGAIVTDRNNKIIGMLIASSSKRSMVVPIQTIIDHLNLDQI